MNYFRTVSNGAARDEALKRRNGEVRQAPEMDAKYLSAGRLGRASGVDEGGQPAELAFFLAAVRFAPAMANGFALRDVARVRAAYWANHHHKNRYGYLSVLREGGFVMVTATALQVRDLTSESVQLWRPSDPVPLSIDGPRKPYWFRPDIINMHLDSLRGDA